MTPERSNEHPPEARKPRIALMGEFSAGKSTLANILMREALSPVQITATQIPPLWYSWADGPPLRIAADGQEVALEDNDLHGAAMSQTRAIRIFTQADVLEVCDLIDMPGSSDPNMTMDVWNDMLPLVDGVIWCSPATQAWRQSEAAMWDELHERLAGYSFLLLTRCDKILSAEDRNRVVKRVRRETASMFRNVHPVSLIDAQMAGDDADRWIASGMDAVVEDLLSIVTELEPIVAATPPLRRDPAPGAALPRPFAAPQGAKAGMAAGIGGGQVRNLPPVDPLRQQSARQGASPCEDSVSNSLPMPRRVVPKTASRTERPGGRRAGWADSLI